MPRGCTKPLYILPFDHRGSFVSKLFGWKGALSAEQSAQVSVTKLVAYDGFEAAVAGGIDEGQAGILLDEHFGPDILRAARSGGIITCAPVEKSGQDEFDFEFGEDFAADVDALAPTLCKVLVRYNPEGDAALNQRQSHRLRRLSDFLSNGPPKFMLELLMPAKSSQLDAVAGNSQAYDRKLRPALMLRVICELQDTGVDPDVWKVEGLDSRDDCERIMATARHDGRANIGGRARIRCLCCWQDHILGAVDRLARREDRSRGGGHRNRQKILQLRRHLRDGEGRSRRFGHTWLNSATHRLTRCRDTRSSTSSTKPTWPTDLSPTSRSPARQPASRRWASL